VPMSTLVVPSNVPELLVNAMLMILLRQTSERFISNWSVKAPPVES
jgi:hypothetical protein